MISGKVSARHPYGFGPCAALAKETMKFAPWGSGWRLVEETSSDVRVIATLKNEVEVLALKRLCEEYATNAGRAPSSFGFSHAGMDYKTYCFCDAGDKLVLHVTAAGCPTFTIQTEFVISKQ
jgi:hypothetical protein